MGRRVMRARLWTPSRDFRVCRSECQTPASAAGGVSILGSGRWVPAVFRPQHRDPRMEPDADPAQPTRSAITDAGIEGNSDNNPRTRSSNPSNTAPAGGLEYEGGPATPTPTRPS